MSKLGFIGLGIMGAPMAEHLIKGGHEVYLQTRSGVPEQLTDAGGLACKLAAEVAEKADIIFLMVPDTPMSMLSFLVRRAWPAPCRRARRWWT